MNKNRLPIDLQYLFQNKYLDCITILILAKEFQRRQKGVILEELLYYFTVMELVSGCDNSYELDKTYFQENYLLNEKLISDYIVVLINQQYVNVYMEKTEKKSAVYLKISKEGIVIIDGLENDFFKEQIRICKYVVKTFKYGVMAQRKAMSKYEK